MPKGAVLSQFAPAASSLFNNMKNPASILASAMVSLGLLNPLPKHQEADTYTIKILRKLYLLITVMSFFSELLAVMWATVAVNQLTETYVAPAASTWDLIERDFALHWAAVNAHFVFGMFGFVWIIGTRALIITKISGTNACFTAAIYSAIGAALSLMVAIVNRGVANASLEGHGFGKTILGLFANYIHLLYRNAASKSDYGLLEHAAMLLFVFAIASAAWGLITEINEKLKSEKEKKDEKLD